MSAAIGDAPRRFFWLPKPYLLPWVILMLPQAAFVAFGFALLAAPQHGEGVPYWMDSSLYSLSPLQPLFLVAVFAAALMSGAAHIALNYPVWGRTILAVSSTCLAIALVAAAYTSVRDDVENARAERDLHANISKLCWERSTLPNVVYQMRSEREAVCRELRDIERTFVSQRHWKWRQDSSPPVDGQGGRH